jgi:hypothetical protein
LNRFGVRVKCISSYFFGLKEDLWRLAHSSHAL